MATPDDEPEYTAGRHLARASEIQLTDEQIARLDRLIDEIRNELKCHVTVLAMPLDFTLNECKSIIEIVSHLIDWRAFVATVAAQKTVEEIAEKTGLQISTYEIGRN